MTALILAALMHHGPDPVTDLTAVREGDGTVTLSWTLPADPSVVGVTIDRFRIDDGHHELHIFQIVGVTATYHDDTALPDRGYRYWVYTRDGTGAHGSGEFVDVFSLDPDDSHHFWSCHSVAATVRPGGAAIFAALGALILAVSLRRRAL